MVKRPPRSLHLPARKPSSWMYFVVRLSTLRGLRPASIGVVVASVRVALSRAARIPPLTRVRRREVGVTKLRRGETSRDDARVAPESRLDDRARVTELGLFPRPESDAIGLVGGPTPTASVACGNATSAQAWPSCAPTVPAPTQLRVLSQNTRLSAKFKISLSRGIVSRPNTIQCVWSADHRISFQCFPTNEVQRKYANISQMFCFRQNSDQFTARTFNDERFAEMFVADALAQTRSITNISVNQSLPENPQRCERVKNQNETVSLLGAQRD